MDSAEISTRLQQVFVQMIPFIMAIVFHEVGHAYVAKRHGDNTARDLGRLTLNPIPHLSLVGTILIPSVSMLFGIPFMFGWAKPVPINFNKLKPYRQGLLLVALAGPATNFILSFLAALIYILFKVYVNHEFYLYEPLAQMAEVAIFINLALAIFNLLPLPPLDGSRIIESFLSFDNARKLEGLQQYSFFILIPLLWSGALNWLLSGPVIFFAELFIGLWGWVLIKLGAPIVLG